jgi:hypothetical protein
MSLNGDAGDDRTQLNNILSQRCGQLERELQRLRAIQEKLQADEEVLMRDIRRNEASALDEQRLSSDPGK